MSSYFFKEHEKLGDSSNFVAWKIRLEIIANNNDVLEYIQGKYLSLRRMLLLLPKNSTIKVSQKKSKL